MLPVFRKSLVLGILLVSCISSQATYVRTFRIAGPYSTILPIKTDTADVNNKKIRRQRYLAGKLCCTTIV